MRKSKNWFTQFFKSDSVKKVMIVLSLIVALLLLWPLWKRYKQKQELKRLAALAAAGTKVINNQGIDTNKDGVNDLNLNVMAVNLLELIFSSWSEDEVRIIALINSVPVAYMGHFNTAYNSAKQTFKNYYNPSAKFNRNTDTLVEDLRYCLSDQEFNDIQTQINHI